MGNCIGGTSGSATVHSPRNQRAESTNANAQNREPVSVAFGVDAALSGLRRNQGAVNNLLGPRNNESLGSPDRRKLEHYRGQLSESVGLLTALQAGLNGDGWGMSLGDDPVNVARVSVQGANQLNTRVETAVDDLENSAGLADDHPSTRFPQGR